MEFMRKGDRARYKGRTYNVVYDGEKNGKRITLLSFLKLGVHEEFWARGERYPVTPAPALPENLELFEAKK